MAAGSSFPPRVPIPPRTGHGHGHGQQVSSASNETIVNVDDTRPGGSTPSNRFCQSPAFESNCPPSPKDNSSAYGGVNIIIPIHPAPVTSLLLVLVQFLFRSLMLIR